METNSSAQGTCLTLYANLVASSSKNSAVASTLKLKIKDDKRVVDLLQEVYDHLQSQNDGNKVYKIQNVSLGQNGDQIKNYGGFVGSYFQNNDEVYVGVDASVDTSRHVQPIAVNPTPSPAAPEKVEVMGSSVQTKYKVLTKYSFSDDHGGKYVTVLLDFPDAKKLLTNDKIQCTFDTRSFEIFIHDYKGENY